MKLSPHWLRDFVDFKLDYRRLADELTLAGIAVEGIWQHEQTVEELNNILVRATQVQTTSGKVKYAAPIFYACMGAFFAGYGYFRVGLSGFLVPLGCGFLVWSVVVLLINRRAYKKNATDA